MSRFRNQDLPALTLSLARKGAGSVAPNPMVGAVVVRDGTVVGRGYHARYGGAHAEAVALADAGLRARGAVLYCNLEPCSYDLPGKHQPPCTRDIINAGITRVIIGQLDPNPLVRGSGVRQLRRAGVEVEIADDNARFWNLNAAFNISMALRRPLVHLKVAMSLDGKIAAASGESKWITDADARKDAHRLRRRHDAVAVGVETVLADDSRLTVRQEGTVDHARAQPRAVVFDSRLRTPLTSYLVRRRASDLVILTLESNAVEWTTRREAFAERGVTVVAVSPEPESEEPPRCRARPIPLRGALGILHRLGIQSLLVEGGATLIASFISARCFDRFTVYIAPLLMGNGISLHGNLGVESPRDALRFTDVNWRRIGDQQVFEGARAEWLDEVRGVVRVDAEEAADVHGAG